VNDNEVVKSISIWISLCYY